MVRFHRLPAFPICRFSTSFATLTSTGITSNEAKISSKCENDVRTESGPSARPSVRIGLIYMKVVASLRKSPKKRYSKMRYILSIFEVVVTAAAETSAATSAAASAFPARQFHLCRDRLICPALPPSVCCWQRGWPQVASPSIDESTKTFAPPSLSLQLTRFVSFPFH